MVSVMIKDKIYIFLIGLAVSFETHAATTKVKGASFAEIYDRAFGGITSILNLLKVFFVVVGFALFGHSVIRLIKISKGEIQGASPMSAFIGMAVAAMLSSVGFWWIVTSNTLKEIFT